MLLLRRRCISVVMAVSESWRGPFWAFTCAPCCSRNRITGMTAADVQTCSKRGKRNYLFLVANRQLNKPGSLCGGQYCRNGPRQPCQPLAQSRPQVSLEAASGFRGSGSRRLRDATAIIYRFLGAVRTSEENLSQRHRGRKSIHLHLLLPGGRIL